MSTSEAPVPAAAFGGAPCTAPLGLPPWFAVQVRPRHEQTAHRALSNKGLECYLPLYSCRHRWSDRLKDLQLPLFPGYLFCRLSFRDKLLVETTPGVLHIVGWRERWLPVAESEISSIRILLASGRPVFPHPYMREGERVCVHSGPLQGLEGILLEVKNIWRVVVSVTLLKRSVSVEVDRECVSPLCRRQNYAAAS